jgi:hypothetical protein
MSRDEAGMKAITKMAAQVAKDHPTLEVLDGMRVAKCTINESKDQIL